MKTLKIQTVVSVFIKNNRLLMEKRSDKKGVYPGFLMCPSGHVENGESYKQAIQREMKEELGIEVKKLKFLFSMDDKDTVSKKVFQHNFLRIISFKGKIKNSKESNKLIWMDYEQLKERELVLIVERLVERLKNKKFL